MNWFEEFAHSIELEVRNENADLALELIAAWQDSPNYVVELKRQRQVSNWGSDDYDVTMHRRRHNAWFGDLRAFQGWLEAQADDPASRLVLALTKKFERQQIEEYLKESIASYLADPPDSDFLRGYLSALLVTAEEALGLRMESHPFIEAKRLAKRYARYNWNARDAA